MSPCRLGGPLFGSDDHKIVSSQQWDFLCWWDVIFTLSRALESAILVIRTESCDVHYFLYVHLSLMLPNKFLSSEFWVCHDNVIKWKHFPSYCPFVRGIHRSPLNSPHKGQWRGALMFSLVYILTKGWANNREAGYLRRHRTHYGVTVMASVEFSRNQCVNWKPGEKTVCKHYSRQTWFIINE